jgi:uncharacterized protein
MIDLVSGLSSNNTLIAVSAAWLLAQGIKVVIYRFQENKWNIHHFFEAGGMPSAHSAAVTSLTLSVGLTLGWQNPLFTACFVFALIVMYDATGVRRAAGKQAELLNKIVDDIYSSGKVEVKKLKEILGHDPIEVVAGASLATVVTLILYYGGIIK